MAPTIERTTIGGTLEIPRMINGLWQLAGGHDQNVEIATASKAMDPLSVDMSKGRLLPCSLLRRINAGLECFDMADHYGDAGS